jgi:hypothetical protein
MAANLAGDPVIIVQAHPEPGNSDPGRRRLPTCRRLPWIDLPWIDLAPDRRSSR